MARRFSAGLAVIAFVFAVFASERSGAHHSGDLDCGDFSSQASAQYHMNAHPGDPDGLDGYDQDGRACESNPCPCYYGSGTSPEPTPTPSPQPTATPSPPPTPPPSPSPSPSPSPPSPSPSATRYRARVLSVTDGDTIKVRLSSGSQKSVRLIGIHTPETRKPGVAVECGGPQATSYMKRQALRRRSGRTVGEKVRLTSDPTQDRVDRYGRMLVYVNRLRDGRDLGKAMIRAGWAMTYVYDDTPFRRIDSYVAAQEAAYRRNRGVWGRCDGDFHSEQ